MNTTKPYFWHELQHYTEQGFTFTFKPSGCIVVAIYYGKLALLEVYSGYQFDHACLACEAWIEISEQEANEMDGYNA